MKKLLIGALVLGLASATLADVILGYDFAGTTTDPELANTVAANVTENSGFARTGLGASSSANAFGGNGWNITDTFAEGDDYMSFSLTADSGYGLTLTDLTWSRINASSTGPSNGRWGYRIGAGAWTYQSDFGVTVANASGSWDFADIENTTSTVEFRFWAYGASGASGTTSSAATGSVTYRNSVAGDDLILNGSVAVIPEPGVLALMAFGGLAIVRFARRRAA
ncbi:MAG: hypothetical protein KA248_03120 [Kiritimatiellae bacterium]|nr:hypothetical protein [Kiritimatiellia bacterium]